MCIRDRAKRSEGRSHRPVPGIIFLSGEAKGSLALTTASTIGLWRSAETACNKKRSKKSRVTNLKRSSTKA